MNKTCVLPLACRLVDWIILDSLQGGSGESFDWRALRPPAASAARGWLLAGGLGLHNVAGGLGVGLALGFGGTCLVWAGAKYIAMLQQWRGGVMQPQPTKGLS